ncbi:MAG: alpha/beta hydrolase [Thermoanaerobaculia bacterium]
MGRTTAKTAAEPSARLVMFDATDGVALSGLLFEPEKRTRRAAIFIHGTGGASVFDSRRTNALARVMTEHAIAWFAFNNRGSQIVRRLKRRARATLGGSALELIRECVADIDGAIRELRRRGYRELYLIGHSTGANKIAVYDSRKPRNPIRRYVLLGGGDDTGLLYVQLGPARFRKAIETARAKIKAGKGAELVPESLSSLPMSWRSFYDMANPDGDYNVFPFLEALGDVRLSRKPRFRHVRGIRKPALMLYGDRDEYCYDDVPACLAVLARAVRDQPNIEIAMMEDADHGFSGHEEELGATIAAWVR